MKRSSLLDPDPENTSEGLESYISRTRDALDAFALLTLWIVVVPLRSFGPGEDATLGGVTVRVAVSVVFAIDIVVRARLAQRSWRYVRTHPLAVIAVFFPPIRVIFSLRLITSLFRRGNFNRFLVAASILLLDGALIVYFSERNAAGSEITTLGGALWWAVVTVTTVGYGDVVPITTRGSFAASGVMVIGVLTLAVVTAQVSSSFNEQLARRRDDPDDDPGSTRTLSELHDRLDRIESHLRIAAGTDPTSPEPGDGPPS